MDPIEKLLSELAPARATDKLDQTMTRLFDRADRRARVRQRALNACILFSVLTIGIAIGYNAGRPSPVTAQPTEITYFVSEEPRTETAYFDYSNSGQAVFAGPVTMTVDIRPAVISTETIGNRGS